MNLFLTLSSWIMGMLVSPIPIIAIIVLSLSGRERSGGFLFILGYFLSIIMIMLLAVQFSTVQSQKRPDHFSIFTIIFFFSIALLFFAFAWKNWHTRPKDPNHIPIPNWIEKFTLMPRGKLFIMGAVANLSNAKNIPIMISAALLIAQKVSSFSEGLITAISFALISSLSIILPWLTSFLTDERSQTLILKTRDWLYHYNNVIMAILFFYMGLTALGKALSDILFNITIST